MSIDLPVIDWFEGPIKQSVTSVFDGINDFVESIDLLRKYQLVHFQILKSSVRSVKILGMQHSMDLARLYYPTNLSTDIRRRIYKPDWAKAEGTPTKTAISTQKSTDLAANFVETNPRTVILGGPGAGKTTLLKYLALAYTDKSIFDKAGLKTSFLPAYLHLPSLSREQPDILRAISHPVANQTDNRALLFFKRLAETGNLVLLLDSLDEVPSDGRQETVKAIQEFATLYSKSRIVISCRTADYQQVFDDFAEAEITRLTVEAVKSIVREWFFEDQKKAE